MKSEHNRGGKCIRENYCLVSRDFTKNNGMCLWLNSFHYLIRTRGCVCLWRITVRMLGFFHTEGGTEYRMFTSPQLIEDQSARFSFTQVLI